MEPCRWRTFNECALPAGIEHPSHGIIRDLIDRGRTWVKLSGAYSNTRVGPPYPDATKIAQAFVKAAPERMVWGSDWPHPREAPDPKANHALISDVRSERTAYGMACRRQPE